jgi:hypothetical protein
LNRNYPVNPATQPVKGILVFYHGEELTSKAQALIKSLSCQIMATHDNRFTVKTSRGNLQAIKEAWSNPKSGNALSKELKAAISNIVIGGAAR